MEYPGKFLFALHKTLINEGYFSDSSWDPGGSTKYGITTQTAQRYGYTLNKLTVEDAASIYYKHYWCDLNLNHSVHSWHIAARLFDMHVNLGTASTVKILQNALTQIFSQNIAVDGKWGPNTANALSNVAMDYERQLLGALSGFQFEHYRSLKNTNKSLYDHAIKGWMRRLYPDLESTDKGHWSKLSQQSHEIKDLLPNHTSGD